MTDPDARPEGVEADHAGIQRFAARVVEQGRDHTATAPGNVLMLAEEVVHLRAALIAMYREHQIACQLGEHTTECAERLEAENEALREALERIASNGCEHVVVGTCLDDPRLTLDAPCIADRICDPCAARRALNPDPEPNR